MLFVFVVVLSLPFSPEVRWEGSPLFQGFFTELCAWGWGIICYYDIHVRGIDERGRSVVCHLSRDPGGGLVFRFLGSPYRPWEGACVCGGPLFVATRLGC